MGNVITAIMGCVPRLDEATTEEWSPCCCLVSPAFYRLTEVEALLVLLALPVLAEPPVVLPLTVALPDEACWLLVVSTVTQLVVDWLIVVELLMLALL